MCPVRRLIGVVCLGVFVIVGDLAGQEKPLSKEQKQKLLDRAATFAEEAVDALRKSDEKTAVEKLTKAYYLERRARDTKHPLLREIIGHIIRLHERLDDFDQAAKAHEERSELLAAVHGPKHPIPLQAKWDADYAKQKAKLTADQRKALVSLRVQTKRAEDLQQRGERGKALPLLQESVAERRKLVGDDNPESAFEMYMVGAILRLGGKPKDSLVPMRRALGLYEGRFGTDEQFAVLTRWNIGLAYRDLGNIPQAKAHMIPALRTARRLDKAGSYSKQGLFFMVQNLGTLYSNDQDSNKALPLLKEAKDRAQALFTKKHLLYVNCLSVLAEVHKDRFELRLAEQFIEEALDICENLVGKKHLEYGRCLQSKGSILRTLGLHKEAEPVLLEAGKVIEAARNKQDYDYLKARNTLALVYIDWGFPRKAELILENFVAVHGNLDNRIARAAGYQNIGLMNLTQGNYVEAERAYSKALAIKQKVRGKQHIDCAITLQGLAKVYQDCGDLKRAMEKLLEAERIYRKAAGKNDVVMVPIWHDLGAFYLFLGDFAKAEEHLKKTLELREKYQGKRHPAYARSLDNMAKFYQFTGDLPKAAILMKEALEIRKAVFAEQHPEYSKGLNNLAAILAQVHKFEQAAELFSEAEAIAKKTKGHDHPERLQTLLNVATCKRILGQSKQAEAILNQALEGFASFHKRSATKSPIPGESTCHLQLAELVSSRGEHKAALALVDRAISIDETIFGKENLETATSRIRRALILSRMGKHGEALVELDRALLVQHGAIRNVFSFATEEDMEQYLDSIDLTFDQFLSVAVRIEKPTEQQRQLVYSWLLRRKGVILETQCRYREASTLLARNPKVANPTLELRGLRKQLFNAVTHPTAETKPMIAKWRERADTLESQLNRRLSSHLDDQKNPRKNPELAKLTNRLPEGAVLIEFVRFRAVDLTQIKNSPAKGSEHYLAFILRSGKKLEMVDLGPADEIDEAVAELRDNLAKTENALASASEKFVESLYRKVAERTYLTLLGPLEEHLEGAKRLVLVPDGSLHRVPFAALVHPEDKKYLIERMPIVYLSSGRDLLRPQRPLGKGVVVFAGPDFDLSVTKRADLAEKLPKIPSGLVLRGPVLRDGVKAWKSLAGAEAEADDIKKATKSGKLGPVTIYKGADAVEERLADLRSPRVLHFATHGFYYQHEERGGPNREDIGLRTRLRGESEALFRSGIVLAGANVKRKDDDKRVEDGWLTAAEAALLDLSGTELVVLSACEAGLGDIKGSEGVYGLRRALFYAGARSIATTLFSVPDAETRLLMKGFYTELAKGTPKGEALHKAQVELIRSRRAKTKAAHPLFWAGFVLVGSTE